MKIIMYGGFSSYQGSLQNILKLCGLIITWFKKNCMLWNKDDICYIPENGPSWSWSHSSWIYNYLCKQCLSPLRLWIWIPNHIFQNWDYHIRGKPTFGSSLPLVVCRRTHVLFALFVFVFVWGCLTHIVFSCLHCLCLFLCGGVWHILCCLVCIVCVWFRVGVSDTYCVVLFALFLFVFVWGCLTHIVLSFCFVGVLLVYRVAIFSGLSIFDCPFGVL